MTARRELAAAVGVAAAAAALLLWVLGRSWAEAALVAEGMPRQRVVVTGSDALAWLRALGFVGLAACGAVLVTAGRWRRTVGALLAGTGAAVAVGAALGADAVDSALLDAVRGTASGVDTEAGAAAVAGADPTLWPWLAVLAGLLLVAAGAFVVVRGPGWPGMSRRYDRTSRGARGRIPAEEPGVEAERGPLDEHRAWRALDEGRDPTS